MNKLPPNKRNQLVLVLIILVAIIGAIYTFLISPQKTKNQRITRDIAAKSDQYEKMRSLIKQAGITTTNLTDINTQLSAAESDVAKGDAYAWTYNTIRQFKTGYHVDINIGQPTAGEVDIISKFPYRQVRVTLDGTAFYHDLGKFIADFENHFPHTRLENLAIAPDESPNAPAEHLTFRMDMVALVKPNN